eukprot:SAG11_NODE_35279_length_267_cov_0.815476_1_plen_52_part_00
MGAWLHLPPELCATAAAVVAATTSATADTRTGTIATTAALAPRSASSATKQ